MYMMNVEIGNFCSALCWLADSGHYQLTKHCARCYTADGVLTL